MNGMKHEDVMRELEEWIYNFNGTAKQFCALCDAIARLREKNAEIERMRGIFAELEEVRLEYLEGKYTEADMVVQLYLIRKKYEEGRKKTNLIDGHLLLKELKEWREQITPDHQDPVVEGETLEGVEHMVRRLMGITEEDDDQ